MNRTILYFVGFFLLIFSQSSAQEYVNCANINTQDSSVVNSAVLTDDGSLITASIHRSIYTSSGAGVPGSRIFGNLVIRKMTSGRNLSWEYSIPNSIGRFMLIKEAPNGDIIATAAFVDSIELGSQYKFYAKEFHSNGLVIYLSSSGQLKWARSQEPQFWSSFYNQFDFRDNKVYLPYLQVEGFKPSMRIQVLSMAGEQVDDIQLANRNLLISEFKFDTEGNLYIAGTGGPNTLVGGENLGSDSATFGYLSYIAKLNPELSLRNDF